MGTRGCFLASFISLLLLVFIDSRVINHSAPDLCEKRCMTTTTRECSPADFIMGYELAPPSCLRCLEQCNGRLIEDDLSALWR